MGKIKFKLLLLSLFLVYTQGLWERLLFFSPLIENFVEISIIAFLGSSFRKGLKTTPGRLYMFWFLLISFIAYLMNGSTIFSWLKFIRFFVYFYLVYSIVWNSYLLKKQWKTLFNFLVFLLILQILGSFLNVFILGIRVEGFVGIMSSLGGTTATVFPVVVISILFTLFLFLKNIDIKKKMIFLLLVLGTSLIGYASAKRAIYFYIPFFTIIIVLTSIKHVVQYRVTYGKLKFLGFFILLVTPVFIFGIKNSGGIGSGLKGGEDNYEIVQKAYNYALYYTNSETYDGNSAGRWATTNNLFSQIVKQPLRLLFGFGYGTHKDIDNRRELKFVYGIVGVTRDLLGGGILFMFITMLIMKKIILSCKSYNFKLTKTLRIILFFIFLLVHITYSSDFVAHLKINYFLAILIAFINSPIHSTILSETMQKYFLTPKLKFSV